MLIQNKIYLGIIRGIDMDRKEFHLLTPEPIHKLNNVNLLVKGMQSLPLEFFYEQDIETQAPYMSYSGKPMNQSQQKYQKNDKTIGTEPIRRKYRIH
jgi:hypothetical protein